MGFSAFPPDTTPQAIADMRQFFRANADIVEIHIEGVPWTEALNGRPFSKDVIKSWKVERQDVPTSAKLYLAVSPLDGMRAGLADYHGSREHMPLPAEFKGRAFDDPIVEKAYLNYCLRAANYFKPDFMAIGIEVNELYHHSPSMWPGYVKLNQWVYHELKKSYPNLPIFTTFTVHSMLNPDWQDRSKMLAAYKELMNCEDIVAISFYPFLTHPPVNFDDAFRWLFNNFDRYGKPYAVGETGENAQSISLETGGHEVHIDGSPGLQAAYYKALLATAQEHRFKFVSTFLYKDYDALWERIKSSSPPWFAAWIHCGFLDGQNHERPAYQLWKRYFAMGTP